MRAEPVPGRLAAVSLNGKLVSSGPVESFPFRLPMPLRSRLELVRTGLRLRLAVRRYAEIAAPREGEDPAERQRRILAFMDDRSFTEFAGKLSEDVDLLFRSTLTRSSGEPEELAAGYGVGYFHLVWDRKGGLSRNILGGSSVLIDALAAPLGGRVRHGGTRDEGRSLREDGVRIEVENGGVIEARAAVIATPAYVTRELVAALPDDTAAALAAIPYGPFVVGAVLTSETVPVPWDDLYAVATPKRSFSMLLNTSNVRRAGETVRAPGGSLMAYAAAGFARRLDGLDDGAVRDAFVADLHEVLPGTKGLVDEVVIKRWERGLPYPRVGAATAARRSRAPLAPVFLAGDYLGTLYTETSVQTGTAAAAGARSLLAVGSRSVRVIVVGGGVVGLSCAFALQRDGHEVEVIEAGEIGRGASAGNAGWVTPTLGTPLAAPGILKTGLRSALDPKGALVIRPRLDPLWARWLWGFARSSRPEAFKAGVAALLGLTRRTLDELDAMRDAGVEFEEHRAGLLAGGADLARAGVVRPRLRRAARARLRGRPRSARAERARELEPALWDPPRSTPCTRRSTDTSIQPRSRLGSPATSPARARR